MSHTLTAGPEVPSMNLHLIMTVFNEDKKIELPPKSTSEFGLDSGTQLPTNTHFTIEFEFFSESK